MSLSLVKNVVMPVVGGGLIAWWVHGMDQRKYINSQHPSTFVRCYERIHQGRCGTITALATGSLCALGLDSLTQFCFPDFKEARFVAWSAFIGGVISPEEIRSKIVSKVLKYSVVAFIVSFCSIPFFKSFNEIVVDKDTSPIIVTIGLMWGGALCAIQTKKPNPPLPATNSNLKKWIQQVEYFSRSSVIGQFGTILFSQAVWIGYDSFLQKAFFHNPHGLKIRYISLFSFLLSACPNATRDFNAFSFIFNEGCITACLLLQDGIINILMNNIKASSSLKIYKIPLLIIPPILWGAAWTIRGELRYYNVFKNKSSSLMLKWVRSAELVMNLSISFFTAFLK